MTAKLYSERGTVVREAPMESPVGVPAEENIGELIQSLASGDSIAFLKFYRITIRNVRMWIEQISSETLHTEDIAQDIYSKIWRSAHKFDPDKGSGWSWVATITKRCAIDHKRLLCEEEYSSDGSDRVFIGKVIDPAPCPEGRLLNKDLKSRIDKHIAGFTDLDREIITRIKMRGHPYHQVAFDLGLNVNTVKTRARRALTRLQELLATD